MPSPNDFTNQARDRLRGMLGGGNRGNNNGGNRGNNNGGNNAGNGFASTQGGNNRGNNNRGNGGGGGGGGGKTPGATGRTCTKDGDCGQNTRCDTVTGTCVARGGGGGGGGGKTPGKVGNACPNGQRDCGQNTTCVNGFCVEKGGGGGGGGGGDDKTCDPECGTGYRCRRGVCVPKNNTTGCGPDSPCPDGETCQAGACVEDKNPGTRACDANNPCPDGQRCDAGVCVTPTSDELLDSSVAENPTSYLMNLAGRGGLNTRGGTSFGNFVTNRFNDIVSDYENQGITNQNLGFRDWLRNQAKYGNPYLQMIEPQVSAPGIREPDVAAARAGGGTGNCTSAADCGGNKPYCVNGTCSKDPAQITVADAQGVTPFSNYLRSQYYGASAYDRGISPANFGAGSTRWSAW